jgi:hypothetical protein
MIPTQAKIRLERATHIAEIFPLNALQRQVKVSLLILSVGSHRQ